MIKKPGPHASIPAACSSGSGACAPRAPMISIMCLACRPRITRRSTHRCRLLCMMLQAIALRSMSRRLSELVQMPCPVARLQSNPAHGSHLELNLNHRSEHVCSEPRQTWAPPRWSCHHGAQGSSMGLSFASPMLAFRPHALPAQGGLCTARRIAPPSDYPHEHSRGPVLRTPEFRFGAALGLLPIRRATCSPGCSSDATERVWSESQGQSESEGQRGCSTGSTAARRGLDNQCGAQGGRDGFQQLQLP